MNLDNNKKIKIIADGLLDKENVLEDENKELSILDNLSEEELEQYNTRLEKISFLKQEVETNFDENSKKRLEQLNTLELEHKNFVEKKYILETNVTKCNNLLDKFEESLSKNSKELFEEHKLSAKEFEKFENSEKTPLMMAAFEKSFHKRLTFECSLNYNSLELLLEITCLKKEINNLLNYFEDLKEEDKNDDDDDNGENEY